MTSPANSEENWVPLNIVREEEIEILVLSYDLGVIWGIAFYQESDEAWTQARHVVRALDVSADIWQHMISRFVEMEDRDPRVRLVWMENSRFVDVVFC